MELTSELIENARQGGVRSATVPNGEETFVRDRESREPDFFHYIIPEARVGGKYRLKINPGNGAAVSYFLYMIDRMTGISVKENEIVMKPELAGQKIWRVGDYRTRLGFVSYELTRDEECLSGVFQADTAMILILPVPPSENGLMINDEKKSLEIKQEADSPKTALRLPPGSHQITIQA